MKRHKKTAILVCVFITMLNMVACGQVKEDEKVQIGESISLETEGNETADAEESVANQQESNVQIDENINLETEGEETADVEEAVINQQESNVQSDENTVSEITTEELLDLFIDGSISAISSTDLTSTFYITDLNIDSEEWDSYSIGEKVDLDNDGENELIICGPYGGIYLDARDNKVYEFAAGEGNAIMLSYVVYDGATWVMYSNRMNVGYKLYHLEKFEGADNLVAEMNFGEEVVDENNTESGMKYTWNGTEISYDEYTELCSRIFATEVNTN